MASFLRKMQLIIIFSSISMSASAAFFESPRASKSDSYTLYRTTPVTDTELWRVHVATFDADIRSSDDMLISSYNRDNCGIAKKLFQSQPNITVNYWCERGFYKEKLKNNR